MNPLRSLGDRLREQGVDALVVSALPNIRYLTGFKGSSGLLLVLPNKANFYTDGRYTLQAAEEVRGAKVITARGPLVRSLIASVKRLRLDKLGFEPRRVTFDFYEALRQGLPEVRLKPLPDAVEKLRAIKTPDEVAILRRSVALNSAVFEACLNRLRPGRTERDVADEIEAEMRRRGGEKPAFETIVAAGVHSALPHAQPTLNPLKKNEFILIDQGVILDGYSSDMTRTVALGGLGRKARSMYAAVLEAQEAAISAVRPGMQAAEVDRQARMVLRKHGLEEHFVHSTGHGVGLEIHEPPRLGRREAARLEAGMVITIEPGVYVPNFGGVRIEDMVLVTETGHEVLTPTSKELRVL